MLEWFQQKILFPFSYHATSTTDFIKIEKININKWFRKLKLFFMIFFQGRIAGRGENDFIIFHPFFDFNYIFVEGNLTRKMILKTFCGIFRGGGWISLGSSKIHWKIIKRCQWSRLQNRVRDSSVFRRGTRTETLANSERKYLPGICKSLKGANKISFASREFMCVHETFKVPILHIIFYNNFYLCRYIGERKIND